MLRWKKLTILLAVLAFAVSIEPATKLGSEFMPTLNEGTLLYMYLQRLRRTHGGCGKECLTSSREFC
jgi:Cu/Ag efflux pump CusA